MPFLAPHTPLDAPEALKAKYAEFDDDRKAPRGITRTSALFIFGSLHLHPGIAVGVARLHGDEHGAEVELTAGELDRIEGRGNLCEVVF